METYATIVPLVFLIPLGGMLLNLIFGRRLGEKSVGAIASIAAGSAFAVACLLFLALRNNHFEAVVVNAPLIPTWISIPSAGLEIPWQFRVDTLSVTMMLIVSGVGTLIHIYAVGYMHGDSRFTRFFVYLNLFLVFMLVLVTANNYLVMFVGWEGVGLCSFLLIGFWFDKKRGEGWKNSNAARKAFIVNRIGDFGFLLAIFMTFWTFGTLDYYKPGEPVKAEGELAAAVAEAPAQGEALAAASTEAHPAVESVQSMQKGVFGLADQYMREGKIIYFGATGIPIQTVITMIVFFMLIGVTGKSAQIPLFVWLPDAMAGPTPVSALIHAATMVTSGLYLLTRSNVFLSYAPAATFVITIVGAATAIFAGFIAIGQWDIKKVLAYSTVSQLGFMVAAVGVGAYTAAFFHLTTHAFFKALLFLGSGSVIHGVEHGHHLANHGHADGHAAHDDHGDEGAHAHDDHDHAAAHDDPAHELQGAHAATNTPIPEEPLTEPAFDAQDMRNMGGLRYRMPVTFWTYLAATLALVGLFPFGGFFSKDEILASVWRSGFQYGELKGFIAFVLLIVAAFFTTFYMWRQIRYVFLGKPRTAAADNAPESNRLMLVPLLILAVLSVCGGLLNLPEPLTLPQFGFPPEALASWLEHSIAAPINSEPLNVPLAISATLITIGAILISDRVYGRNNPLTKKGRDPLEAMAQTRAAFVYSNAKGYTDDIYGRLFEQPFNRASLWLANRLDQDFLHDYVHERLILRGFDGVAAFLSGPVDRNFIDRGFLGLGGLVRRLSNWMHGLQTGYVRTYVFTMLVGVLLVLFLILFPLLRQLIGG